MASKTRFISPSDKELRAFSAWVISRGRDPSTAEQYVKNLRLCFTDSRGPLARVSTSKLSPNSRRANMAALRAWSSYKGLKKLRKRLEDIRLPPKSRVKEKRALDIEDWKALKRVGIPSVADPALRAVMTMIACRGFRISDVCRMRRSEVRAAVNSGAITYTAKGSKPITWSIMAPWDESVRYLASRTKWKRVWDLISPRSSPESRPKSAVRRIQRGFDQAFVAAGIDPDMFSPHSLRRTYAWHFLKECEDVVKLQKHMQWASLQTAFQYVDQSEREELDELAATLSRRLES